MEDLYLLLKKHIEDPQKALDVLADTIEKNRGGYNIDDIISALRGYQGEQLIDLARKNGIDVYADLKSLVKHLELSD